MCARLCMRVLQNVLNVVPNHSICKPLVFAQPFSVIDNLSKTTHPLLSRRFSRCLSGNREVETDEANLLVRLTQLVLPFFITSSHKALRPLTNHIIGMPVIVAKVHRFFIPLRYPTPHRDRAIGSKRMRTQGRDETIASFHKQRKHDQPITQAYRMMRVLQPATMESRVNFQAKEPKNKLLPPPPLTRRWLLTGSGRSRTVPTLLVPSGPGSETCRRSVKQIEQSVIDSSDGLCGTLELMESAPTNLR